MYEPDFRFVGICSHLNRPLVSKIQTTGQLPFRAFKDYDGGGVPTAARRPDPSRSILAMDETLFKPTNGAYPAAGTG